MAASKLSLGLSRWEGDLTLGGATRWNCYDLLTTGPQNPFADLAAVPLWFCGVKGLIMHDPQTVQRFIELRAQGWIYARLMAELNVSKPTLIAWSHKHQFEIQNLKAIELESLREKWLAATTDRVNGLGEQLQRVEAELGRRDLATLTTPQLFALARSLRRQIEQATGPVAFTLPVAQIPATDYHEQVQDWSG